MLTAIFAICLLIYICRLLIKLNKKKIRGFPKAPGQHLLFGHCLLINSNEEAIGMLERSLKDETTVIVLMGLDTTPIFSGLLSKDPKLMEICLSQNQKFKKSFNYLYLRPWLGKGLLISEGSYWKRHRKILTPAFHFDILKEFVETFEKCGNVLIEKLAQFGSDLDIQPLVTLYTLDVICETAMGTKINAQEGQNRSYVDAVGKICHLLIGRCLSPIKLFDCSYAFTKDFGLQKNLIEILHGFTSSVIDKRKENFEVKNNNKKLNFLDLLLRYSKKGENYLSAEEIRAEVDTFMFEGHDTTASGICFTLHCLAENPHIQDKLLQEQKELFGDEKNPTVTFAELHKMKYLEKVLKESMRLYPPVPILGRWVKDEFCFEGNRIPSDSQIVLFIYGMHRNPEIFPEPEKFYPERFDFMDGSSPYCYIPFSAGSRNCIGQKFAMLEMKSAISKIIRHFKILPSTPKHEMVLSVEVVLKSINGVKVKLEKRN